MPLLILGAAGVAALFWGAADATGDAADSLAPVLWAGAALGGVIIAGRVLKVW